MKKNSYIAGLILLVLLISSISWKAGRSAEPSPPAPTASIDRGDQTIEDLEMAVLDQFLSSRIYGVGMPRYGVEIENIRVTAEGDHASGWIVRLDPETGDMMPSEPGIFIGEKVDDEWVIHLPTDSTWREALRAAPDELLPLDEKNRLLGMDVPFNDVAGITADDGYLLPWAEGVPVNLSRSVSHDEDIPSGNAHYSFDFYIPQTMFNLYAAKAGTVWAYKDTVPNNDHSDVNFIVLRNADNPNLYQLYLHLAQNSIPPSLKTIGAQVIQGQFVGVADNTGASTGHHLHFQVQTQPYWPVDNPYWGVSVDITFDDVDIYGGRPRRTFEYDSEICGGYCEDGLLTYVSENTLKGDLTPPIGDFAGVTMGQIVGNDSLYLSGWASDADSGLYSGQLRALYDGSWHNIGSPFYSTFSYTMDLCDSENPIPKGMVSLGLRLYDWDGNWADYAGLKHFIKSYDCPHTEQACIPGVNQVTLFEDVNFSGGCQLLDVGDYPNAQAMGALGDNDAGSIRLGDNVQATLYSQDGFAGHSETLTEDDNNLADNLIGLDTLSSAKIGLQSSTPNPPVIHTPTSGANFSEWDLIPLSWINGGNSVAFQVSYSYNGGAGVNLPWRSKSFYYLDNLNAGSYTWKVRGRNSEGVSGPWSQATSFNVIQPPTVPPAINPPYSDDMETSEADWTSSGLWDIKDDSEMSHSGTHAWWYQGGDGDYDTSSPNFGSLTSPAVNIPSEGYFLQFWYRYGAESNNGIWDQRWVQVSLDGESFMNLYQLLDDPQMSETSSWLQSAAIDLSDFSGHSVRIRFQFATLDAELNAFPGWGIDDFTITNIPPPICSDNRQDDTPGDAYEIAYSETDVHSAEICPGGDYDFYRFTGSAGDRIVVDVDAQSDGSPLDSYLHLIDSDGASILAEHDDEVYAEQRDPLLAFTLPHNGIYFIKVRAWKHPAVGGGDYDYALRLYQDDQDPFVNVLNPLSNSYIPVEPFSVTVQAVDVLNGISHIDIYWHDYDWVFPAWEMLGTDRDGTDGWKISFDPTGLLERDGGAFYVKTYDKAGNWSGAGVWNVGVDLTPPSTSLLPLAESQESTAVMINWQGTDAASGINYVNLQYTLDENGWFTYPNEIHSTQVWFIGNAGHDYGFRIRGVDHAGNIENYPTNPEVSTIIPPAEVLCSNPDIYESGDGDNSHELATVINPDGGVQIHNFCNPDDPGYLNDEDWLKFNVKSGTRYLIQGFPMNGNAAVSMELYASDGTTLLDEGSSSGFGRTATVSWISDRESEVYFRLRHIDGRVIGNLVLYQVHIQDDYQVFFPLLSK